MNEIAEKLWEQYNAHTFPTYTSLDLIVAQQFPDYTKVEQAAGMEKFYAMVKESLSNS